MVLEVSWDGLWTHSFGLSQIHGHGSWLVCEVALRRPDYSLGINARGSTVTVQHMYSDRFLPKDNYQKAGVCKISYDFPPNSDLWVAIKNLA